MKNYLLLTFLFVFFCFKGLLSQSSETDYSAIDFVKFKADLSSKIIHFNWVVNSESFGSQFRIEKLSSVDSVWREIAVLSSRKNHSDIHKYEFSSINIIRSAKESFKLIRIDSLNNETELDSLDIFHPYFSNLKVLPVPGKVTTDYTASFDSLEDLDAKIYSIDINGDYFYEKKIKVNEGYNRIEFSVKSFPPGNYLIVVKAENEDKISKSLVVHNTKRKK
jgi:hypothetical protein